MPISMLIPQGFPDVSRVTMFPESSRFSWLVDTLEALLKCYISCSGCFNSLQSSTATATLPSRNVDLLVPFNATAGPCGDPCISMCHSHRKSVHGSDIGNFVSWHTCANQGCGLVLGVALSCWSALLHTQQKPSARRLGSIPILHIRQLNM